VRLFVALDVPGSPDLHMTLAFLGEHPEADVPAIEAAVERGLRPAGELRPRRFLALPRRRPRVVALEYADPTGACAALQAAIAEELVAAGLFEPERRRWLPHVSVARIRRGEPMPDPSLEDMEAFTPEQVVLYRSHLGRGPARYEALRSWALPVT
jgi:2'-5' RNA ligase